MKAEWIERCVNAAGQATGDVASLLAERLRVELQTKLSLRSLRPKESNELADE